MSTPASTNSTCTRPASLVGLRLASGLHLGHYIGNLEPAIHEQETGEVFVLLADLLTLTSRRLREATYDNALALIADCMAAGLNSEHVHFALESHLAYETAVLQVIVASLTGFNQLAHTQPLRGLIAQKPDSLTAGEVFFPIIQTTDVISLRVSWVLSNVDNLGIVDLAQRAARKLAYQYALQLPVPRLKHGRVAVVRGPDRRKMSHNNNNAILLKDEPGQIMEKVSRIRTDPVDPRPHTALTADHALVFEYCRLFGMSDSEIASLDGDYQAGRVTSLDIKRYLFELLERRLAPIRQTRTHLLSECRPMLRDRLAAGTGRARKIAARNSQMIVDRVLSTATEPLAV